MSAEGHVHLQGPLSVRLLTPPGEVLDILHLALRSDLDGRTVVIEVPTRHLDAVQSLDDLAAIFAQAARSVAAISARREFPCRRPTPSGGPRA